MMDEVRLDVREEANGKIVAYDKNRKNSKKNKPLLNIEYNFYGKIFILLFRIFMTLVGLFLIFIDNIFVNFLGFMLIIFGILDFINILTFYRLIFCQDELVKEYYFFNDKHKKRLNYSDLEVMVSKRFFGGTLMFWKKNKRWKTILFFKFDLFPIKNEEFKKIKKILIEKNIIKGDENEWNY
jgi:hypothetical protein